MSKRTTLKLNAHQLLDKKRVRNTHTSEYYQEEEPVLFEQENTAKTEVNNLTMVGELDSNLDERKKLQTFNSLSKGNQNTKLNQVFNGIDNFQGLNHKNFVFQLNAILTAKSRHDSIVHQVYQSTSYEVFNQHLHVAESNDVNHKIE
ncbi:hypothetical protein ACF3NR_06485 [Vaginella massiliensis]|uniref:hypothetical protein n=1 Tax=Vaginella massiliensis TaxID=1816680 RepID=UPI000839067D|nr:hypothetical protein [Vaginella massiliensis]